MSRRRVPLAWRNLSESKRRLLASVAGTAFAVVLMFMENGFKTALVDSMSALIERLDGELVIINPARYMLTVEQSFPRMRLYQAENDPDVVQASPMYIEAHQPRWQNPNDGIRRRIRVIAYPPDDDLLDVDAIIQQRDKLQAPDTALADSRSREYFYGSFLSLPTSELADHRIHIVGTFAVGADFQNNGNLVMSEANFLRLFPLRAGPSWAETMIDVGVLRVRPDADIDAVQRRLTATIPADVVVLTKEQFILQERHFWEKVTPVGAVFNIGLVMGFVVGLMICYQVLFSDITDRLAEFATLKAIGCGDRTLFGVVAKQAIILAVLGYSMGLVVSLGLYWLVGEITGLPLRLGFQQAAMLFLVTLAMCVLSGCVAVRKLFSTDPADLFQ